MKIKSFDRFEIELFCAEQRIGNYTINDDLTVDVDGNVELVLVGINEIPIKFGNVAGNFDVGDSKLESLSGSPRSVGRNFLCDHCNLSSLVGCPTFVRYNFMCSDNKITSFEGFPESVGMFNCNNNPIFEIWDLNPKKEFAEMLNEYDVIRGKNVIYLRLVQALIDSGQPLKIPKEEDLKRRMHLHSLRLWNSDEWKHFRYYNLI